MTESVCGLGFLVNGLEVLLLLVYRNVMPNCSVKMSPHGDVHDEQEGSPARGADHLAAANAALPSFIVAFNRRVARPPQEAGAVWRRPPAELDLILSCRHSRVISRDHTVRVGDRCLQVPRQLAGRSYAGYRVDVRELLSGELAR